MYILREYKGIVLNEGNLAASGLFNVYNTETKGVSDWFCFETKDELLSMSDEDFYQWAIKNIETAVNNIW